ncbi:MAG: hypothetical protein IT203_07240 [Fimbriimonadaceae bacterium]|nr:hypothetical protein [Fimbriimonadaceae bacterium]
MVHPLVVLCIFGTSSIQADTPLSNAEPFLPKIRPFLERAERGILDHSPYTPLDLTSIRGRKIGDLKDAYSLSVPGAHVEWDDAVRLTYSAMFETLYDKEPPFNPALTMSEDKVEPLVNEYARAAGYPYKLKVKRLRLSMNVPIHYEVSVIPVHQGIPYSSGSSGRFEIDYRHGRLIDMILYGAPKPPEDTTPRLTLEQARALMLQAVFGRYGMPGVEEPKPTELAIAGFPEKVENDDAVKRSQRVWKVQGKLVYETWFDHIDRWGEQGIPLRKYRVMIDANTGEVISLASLTAGTGILNAPKRRLDFPTQGAVTAAFGKRSKALKTFRLVKTNQAVSKSNVRVVLSVSNLATLAKYDPASGLLRIGDVTYIPNDDLGKALRELTRP